MSFKLIIELLNILNNYIPKEETSLLVSNKLILNDSIHFQQSLNTHKSPTGKKIVSTRLVECTYEMKN